MVVRTATKALQPAGDWPWGRWGAGLAYPASPKPLPAWVSGFFKQQQFLERLGLSDIPGKTQQPQPHERDKVNIFILVVSWARVCVQFCRSPSVRIHCTAAVWSFLRALELPSYCKGLHSLPGSELLCLSVTVPLVFYDLLSLYLQFLQHLSETHLKFQHQGIEISRFCSWPFLEPQKEQPWSFFLCRVLTHLYPWQMPERCQNSSFPPWERAKVCAHSAL